MQPKRVALLVDTATAWGSQIILGASDFVRQMNQWVLYVDQRGAFESSGLPAGFQADGVIGRLCSNELGRQIQQLGLPCVNVSANHIPQAEVQDVLLNEARVGELAAEALLARGLRSFGYYAPPKQDFYSDQIFPAFEKAILATGASLETYQPDRLLRSDSDPHFNLAELCDWLADIPKPCGLFAWNSLGAHRLIQACMCEKLRVPEDCALLAADNDPLLAEIAIPHLTCIEQAPRRAGYLAAAELHRLMSGGVAGEPVMVEPQGVVYRESLPQNTIRDPLVADSVAFIETNVHRNITITDLIEHVTASRRSLELRFRRALGRGPAAEIRRRRLENACRLLSQTELPVKQIASQCGFASPEQLQRQLRNQTSLTPTRYRKFHHAQTILQTASVNVDLPVPGRMQPVIVRKS